MAHDVNAIRVGTFDARRLGFGTMQLTGPGVWGPPTDRSSAIAVLRTAHELGVDFFDTADSYGPFVAEELIREALHPYAPGVRIATKAGFERPGPNVWVERGDRDHLRARCESSLQRLGVEAIDLFQLHRIDPTISRDEQFATLRELRVEGKVLEVGLSEVTVAEIQAAQTMVPIASVQNHYNIAHRGADDVVDYCTAQGIAFIPWFPLGSGGLTRSGGPLDAVAAELRASTSQLCLAWLLQRSPMMLPIPGTSSVEHLRENLAAGDLTLNDAQYADLDGARKAVRRWALSN